MILRGITIIHELAPFNLTAKVIRSICDGVLPFANLYLSALIIDSLASGIRYETVAFYVILTVLINAGVILLSQLMDTINYEKWNLFYKKYNMTISEKVLSLDYEKIEDPQTHVTVKNIDDAMKISNYGLIKLHSRIPLFVEHFISLILSSWLIVLVIVEKGGHDETYLVNFANTPQADFILLLSIALVTLSTVLSNANIARKTYFLLGTFSKLNRVFEYYLSQYLNGHNAGKDIRLYQQDRLIRKEIGHFSTEGGEIVKKINSTVFFNQAIISSANLLLVIIAYSFVGLKAIAGVFGIGSILKYSGGILQFSTSLSNTMDALSPLRANSRYLKVYLDFMDLPDYSHNGQQKVGKSSGNEYRIEFRNVSFKYPASESYSLRGVSFTLNMGKRLAIVGMNGSGKTTMIKLLCRLYEPTEGEITLNGIDIREYDYDEYLALFSVVFQDFKLFSFPLGENVASSIIVDSQKATEALIKAGFAERLAQMPDGLQTPLYKDFSDAGMEISGGEAQKIAIARALYKEAPFIIFDEPTAALDPIAEYEIYANLKEIVMDRTAIFISHRLSSCRFCDEIAVFHEGRLVQCGNHEALVNDKTNKYYELWNAQAQYYNLQS